MEIGIICPLHLEQETINVPDSYSHAFEGIVACSGSPSRAIYIKLRHEGVTGEPPTVLEVGYASTS